MTQRYKQSKFNSKEGRGTYIFALKRDDEANRVAEYVFRLIEWELKKLLKEMSGDENFKHFYKID